MVTESFELHWTLKIVWIVSMAAIIRVNIERPVFCDSRQIRKLIVWFVDWACGGQWNRAFEFVRLLIEAFSTAHIELIVFFDGKLNPFNPFGRNQNSNQN